jgi:1L-myo-inositol 1-phosphate cytidylyltransferase / CDP-L-myo-inositol myo-inositolphosphotransferase
MGVTLFNVAVGLTGALLLSRGGYWSQLEGTLVFLLCVVLDGVDGEIARLKLQATRFGHYLDIITDNVVHVAIFAGIGIGLYHQTENRMYLQLLLCLLGGFVVCGTSVYMISNSGPDRGASKTTERMIGLLANRDFA